MCALKRDDVVPFIPRCLHAIVNRSVTNDHDFFSHSTVKVVTLPLTTSQLESTTKMQKLVPLQKRIQERFAEDEATKNKYLSQLFQAANVNPLAGCFPALIQIPIFISLYRALQNLVAENKLDEPFLWIPDLEGPVYAKPPGESLDWIKSIISGYFLVRDLLWQLQYLVNVYLT